MGRADFFVRRKKEKEGKSRLICIPHPARLSSFSPFFQIILWH
jgi:hypothetical protein